jgi:predicted AAA+ superfamily ATPase
MPHKKHQTRPPSQHHFHGVIENLPDQVRDKLGKFPAVAIIGPRQCGKTTLARTFDGAYFDMETVGSETRLDAEWDTLTSGEKLIIIDEAQQSPTVLPRLRGGSMPTANAMGGSCCSVPSRPP